MDQNRPLKPNTAETPVKPFVGNLYEDNPGCVVAMTRPRSQKLARKLRAMVANGKTPTERQLKRAYAKAGQNVVLVAIIERDGTYRDPLTEKELSFTQEEALGHIISVVPEAALEAEIERLRKSQN